MNKRGQGGLSMNTIIVAIIAVIVLLLIVTFFTGGLTTIFGSIRDVFSGGTAGFDVDLARANCQSFCERASDLDVDQQANSAWCQRTFNVAPASGGEPVETSCWQSPISETCSQVTACG